jgi:Uma2 family endonuclease
VPSASATVPTEPHAFVAWENRRARRYELIAGEVRMMAGGSRAHDLVGGNLLASLRDQLRARGCDVHGSNLKVVSPVGMVTYPDVFIRCGPLDDEATECDDPVAVIEVLSPKTRSEDLVRKRWGYQAIPTLRHLVYVDPLEPKLEVCTREADGSWRSAFVQGLSGRMSLSALAAEVALADLYAGTRVSAGSATL